MHEHGGRNLRLLGCEPSAEQHEVEHHHVGGVSLEDREDVFRDGFREVPQQAIPLRFRGSNRRPDLEITDNAVRGIGFIVFGRVLVRLELEPGRFDPLS